MNRLIEKVPIRRLSTSSVLCRGVQVIKKRDKIPKPRKKFVTHGQIIQDLPEFRDRVSLIGHHPRPGRMKIFTMEKLNERLNRTDRLAREWEEFLEHEYKDRDPYNYPLYGVEKTTQMLRDEGYEEPNLLAYPSLLIQMSSFCFTTLHEFRRILLRQFGKMDFDIEDIYASHPDEFHITYNDEDPVKMQKYKRNIVVINVNAFEMSALMRQIAEFTPESVTVTVVMAGNYGETKYNENEESRKLSRLIQELKKTK